MKNLNQQATEMATLLVERYGNTVSTQQAAALLRKQVVHHNGLQDLVWRYEAKAKLLADALWVCSEHNALHFGENHSTVQQSRSALATEPTIKKPMSSRQEFEEKAEADKLRLIKRESDGAYWDNDTALAWDYWQAATSRQEAKINSFNKSYGWLYTKGADGQWVTSLKLEGDELEIAHDQEADHYVAQGTKVRSA